MPTKFTRLANSYKSATPSFTLVKYVESPQLLPDFVRHQPPDSLIIIGSRLSIDKLPYNAISLSV